VTASTAATSTARLLAYANGEEPPRLALKREDGRERDGDDQRREEAGAADLLDRAKNHRRGCSTRPAPSIPRALWDCSTTTIAASTTRGAVDASQGHDVRRSRSSNGRTRWTRGRERDQKHGGARCVRKPGSRPRRSPNFEEGEVSVDGSVDQLRSIVTGMT
jgi:hypothetical protein